MMSNFTVLMSAWFLVGGGLLVLLILIPWLSTRFKGSEANTEFLSTRAAYWCVIAGLVLLIIAELGLAAENLAAVLRRN
jgi:hypothetical protein